MSGATRLVGMASGNRVEELESRVRDLEATVDGLTDELVECKVRIRELESVVDAEIGLDSVTAGDAGSDEPTDRTASDAAEATKPEPSQGEDNAESDESDIIVA